VAVLIPSIDLMGGKIVQLEQGEKKKLEFEDFDYWIAMFEKFPLVQVIDLDAARASGENRALVKQICARLKCQVGGGIRNAEAARELLNAGAQKVIIGSSLLRDGKINPEHVERLAKEVTPSALVFAVDSRGGRIAIDGWRTGTTIRTTEMMRELEPFCRTFLYTHIDTEGLMGGIPMDVVRELRGATLRKLVVAGGIREHREIDELDAMGVDCVVGMAVYSRKISV
jgi:phosphoribosylformimino-5-aminoimidazole carboxamide ribotide isomerase